MISIGAAEPVSYRRVESLGEAINHGVLLKITCGNAACGRTRVVAPIALLGRFDAGRRLATIGRHLICRGADLTGGGCGHRGALVTFVLPDPPQPDGPPPGGTNVVPFERRAPAAPTVGVGRLRRVARGRRHVKKRSHFQTRRCRRRTARDG